MEKFDFRGINSGLLKDYYVGEKIGDLDYRKILFEDGIEKEGINLTPVDSFFIPENFSKEDKLKLIASNLKLETNELEKKLPEISRYWNYAKEFFRTFLLNDREPAFPKEIEELTRFRNLTDLEKTLSKATRLKNKDSLGFGPIYCALFSIMIAEREYARKELSGLHKESEYVAEKMFAEDDFGVACFQKIKEEDDEWTKVRIMTKNKSIKGRFSYRGKTKESVLCKLLRKPEFTAEEAIKDGVGLRFEVSDKESAFELFPFLCEFLKTKFKAKRIIFENVFFFTQEENELMQKELKDLEVSFAFEENRSSHKNFRAAKIRGELEVPKDGKEGKMLMTRNFEAQVVLVDNQNETGLAQSKIYKRVQKLSLFSRLFGSFGERYLDLVCEEASEASNIAKEKIKKHIADNFLLKLRLASGRIKYVSKEQFERWEKAKIVPTEILRLVSKGN